MDPTESYTKTKREVSLEDIDRISDLGDDLLIKILSFLSTKEAVQTSLLAKRFQNLWTAVPVLEFSFDHPDEDEDNIYDIQEKFIKFVDGVFEHRDPFINLDSFKIKWVGEESNPFRATNWLEFVAKLKPKFVSVHIFTKNWFDLPDSIFSCESLQEMDIRLGFEVLRPRSVNLPCLKKVSLHSINIVDEVMQKLSGLPGLETMVLYYCLFTTCDISSGTLKCLVLDGYYNETETTITVSTPSLLYLGVFSWKMGTIKFEKLESLLSACIHYHKDPLFLTALSNATYLELILSKSGVLEMNDVLKEETTEFPTFHNLKTLKIGEWCMSDEFDVVGRFLFHARNLEKLTLVHRHCQERNKGIPLQFDKIIGETEKDLDYYPHLDGHYEIEITFGMGGSSVHIMEITGEDNDEIKFEIREKINFEIDELLERVNKTHQENKRETNIISS